MTLELLRANGKDKMADTLEKMPEGPAKNQQAARLAATLSNVTEKVPGQLIERASSQP